MYEHITAKRFVYVETT